MLLPRLPYLLLEGLGMKLVNVIPLSARASFPTTGLRLWLPESNHLNTTSPHEVAKGYHTTPVAKIGPMSPWENPK